MSSRVMLPSSDTKPTTCRKPAAPLPTFTPCRCTSCGSSGIAPCSLFCTCTCAMSGSVPFWKLSVTEAMPALELFEDM